MDLVDGSPRVLHTHAIPPAAARSPVDLYRAAHSGAPYLEFTPIGVTKASVLAALCAEAGLDRTQVAAIGDAINDAPMLSWAGTALCPAQAAPEIHAIADRVLAGND